MSSEVQEMGTSVSKKGLMSSKFLKEDQSRTRVIAKENEKVLTKKVYKLNLNKCYHIIFSENRN